MKRAALSAESTMSTPPFTFGWLATMPIGRPARRANPTMISWAKRRLISNHEPASMTRSITSYMSKYLRWSYGTISSMDRPAFAAAASRGRQLAGRLRHVGEVATRQHDRLPVGARQHVAPAGNLAVHERAPPRRARRL